MNIYMNQKITIPTIKKHQGHHKLTSCSQHLSSYDNDIHSIEHKSSL